MSSPQQIVGIGRVHRIGIAFQCPFTELLAHLSLFRIIIGKCQPGSDTCHKASEGFHISHSFVTSIPIRTHLYQHILFQITFRHIAQYGSCHLIKQIAPVGAILIFRSFQITDIFTSSQQKSTYPEISFRISIDYLSRNGLLTNRLYVTNLAILLQSSLCQIVPCFIYHRFIHCLIQIAIIDSPKEAVSKESRSAGFRSGSMSGIHHATGPIAFRLLDSCDCFGQFHILVYEKRTMLVISGKIFQHLRQSGKHPSVTTCPKVLLSAGSLVFRINIFGIPIIQAGFPVEHDTIRIYNIFIQFIQIEMIARHLIQFGHDRHYHIQTVAPPPVIMIGCTHLILHHFAGTGYLIVVRKNSIKVDICLKTNLIISEQYIFITLTVRVFPFRLILFLGSLPFIVYSPGFRICTVVFITGQKVCLHISGVVSGIVPKRTDFGLVMRLPISVYLVYNPPYFLGFGRRFGDNLHGKQQGTCTNKGLFQ